MSLHNDLIQAIAAFYEENPTDRLTVGDLRDALSDYEADDVDDQLLTMDGDTISLEPSNDPTLRERSIVVPGPGGTIMLTHVFPLVRDGQ